MKRLLKSLNIFGMSNLVPSKTGIPVDIWSQHKGIQNKVSHRNTPRVKISTPDVSVSVTIEENPKIKSKSGKIKKSDKNAIEKGIAYVGRNYDLFLKHYMDTDDTFDDEDLFNALRQRGEYK